MEREQLSKSVGFTLSRRTDKRGVFALFPHEYTRQEFIPRDARCLTRQTRHLYRFRQRVITGGQLSPVHTRHRRYRKTHYSSSFSGPLKPLANISAISPTIFSCCFLSAGTWCIAIAITMGA